MSTLNLLDLPTEVSDQIFAYVFHRYELFEDEGGLVHLRVRNPTPEMTQTSCIGLLHVCKKIFHQAFPVLYQQAMLMSSY